jgi:protein-tyrosine phosphatase
MAQLLFVCEGNVCRSAFAERVLRHALSSAQSARPQVSSAGLTALDGWGIAEETAALIDLFGADSRLHAARKLLASDIENATLVLTATRDHRGRVVRMLPQAVQYTFTIRQFGHVLESASPDGLDPVAPEGTPVERLTALVELFRQHRDSGAVRGALDDVVDPFTKPVRVHELAASQMLPALNVLSEGLGAGPLIVPTRLMPKPDKPAKGGLWRGARQNARR